MDSTVYTIGHSNHLPEVFVQLLTHAKIDVVVDVRSNPGSPWVSYANPRHLKSLLREAGIQYLYLGDSLGGRPENADCYDQLTGKADYQTIRKTPLFRQGLSRLLENLERYRTCIMCAEEDPSSCHRNLLIGEALRHESVRILHIRGTGQIQTDEELWNEKAGVGANQLRFAL